MSAFTLRLTRPRRSSSDGCAAADAMRPSPRARQTERIAKYRISTVSVGKARRKFPTPKAVFGACPSHHAVRGQPRGWWRRTPRWTETSASTLTVADLSPAAMFAGTCGRRKLSGGNIGNSCIMSRADDRRTVGLSGCGPSTCSQSGRSAHTHPHIFAISPDVSMYYISTRCDWYHQGPVSRLGSRSPRIKTGPRLSPHLAPSTTFITHRGDSRSRIVSPRSNFTSSGTLLFRALSDD